MKNKIHYEPVYDLECSFILESMINGTSIKDEMEESIEKRNAEAIRPSVEEIFKKPLALEKFFKDNVCLNLPGYEENGAEMAKFLFKKWERSDTAPINAIQGYNLALAAGIDNKAIVILYTIDEDYMEKNIWGLQEMEAGTPPPFIDDSSFFGLINNSHLEQEGKLRALQLFYDFDKYRTYAQALLQHAEGLLKAKVGEYTKDIRAHMDILERDWLANDAANIKSILGFEINDGLLYNIYPGIYQTNSIRLTATPISEPYIIMGMGVLALKEVYDNAETDNEKAAQFLKCLSDGTKQTILQLLKNESLYGGQLAEKLNCSSANISQHMSALSNLGVIRYKKENNRVYFELNKDVIHSYLETAKGLFG